MSNKVVYRQTCPNCKSQGKDRHGDNLAVYDDGHKWCYSCSYHESASGLSRILKMGEQQHVGNLRLPEDATKQIAFPGMQWLSQYEITRDEIKEFGLLWSPSRKWLLFPVYSGNDILLMYQARTFTDNFPKYLTFGQPEKTVNILHQKKDYDDEGNVVVVEDIISAIKVGRTFSAMPLYGSFLSQEKLNKLMYSRVTNLIFWLDYDKHRDSLQLAQKTKAYGFQTSLLVTAKDPKEYNDSEICDFISPCLVSKLCDKRELLEGDGACC